MGHVEVPVIPTTCDAAHGTENGNNCGPINSFPANFTPVHEVRLRPFFIDKYPVSNKDYLQCQVAGLCPEECQVRKTCAGGFLSQYSLHDGRLAEYPVATIEKAGADAC